MKKIKFIHLNLHSEYSIVDGLIKIDRLIQKAVETNIPALALTDFSNFHGLIKFYDAACSASIKPIIGVDFLVENSFLNRNLNKLTILAKNNEGYKNLILLITNAYKKGYDSSKGPTIKKDWLIKYKKGIIILSGGLSGDIGQFLLSSNKNYLMKSLEFYQKNFFNNYYFEITRIGFLNEENYISKIVKLSRKQNIPIVATNNVRFMEKDDFIAHEIRVSIHDGFQLNDPKRPKNYTTQQYLKSMDEMVLLFSDIPEALQNTVEVAKRCNVSINLSGYFLPSFVKNGESEKDLIEKYSHSGLKKRLKFLYSDKIERNKNKKRYFDRLNSELKVIKKMGFSGYFLIVMEFVEWSKKNKISVGPGRGSGAGSLVAYSLNITDLDPLEFNLLFERFLNSERISMPDFDIDFCVEGRDKVIEHVEHKYGKKSVSQIITFGAMTAKAVIKDVGRVLGYTYSFVDKISKLIPFDPGITLKKALEVRLELKNLYDYEEDVKELINISKKLEGVIRNVSKHAGGVVISPNKIVDFMPLYYDSEGKNSLTQFDKDDIEKIGLVKFDFLGLKTLTVIQKTLKMINFRRSQKKLNKITLSSNSFDDKNCFKQLQKAETTALFQLESYGMRDLIRKLRPDCFEDLIALVALFRPGPLQSGMVDNFIKRKHGQEEISYPDPIWQHDLLKPVLSSTYGIILYQEQVMQIAQVLADYSLGSADILRRAMGKKKTKEMSDQRSIFIKRAKKKSINTQLAEKIFDILEKFSFYGFNKSHSTAYAIISYQTLWLKTYYPAEFMASVMTLDIDNPKKIVSLINECRKMGLTLLPPNINTSFYYFHVNEKNEIIYGIGAIKGIGESLVNDIISIREKNGVFKKIFDFLDFVDFRKFNKKVIERLVMSGALDCLVKSRESLFFSLKEILKISDQRKKCRKFGQIDMFGFMDEEEILLKNEALMGKKSFFIISDDLLRGEYEALGVYLTRHPVISYLSEINYYTKGLKLKDLNKNFFNKKITICGLLMKKKILINRLGGKFFIFTIDDSTSQIDIICNENFFNSFNSFIEMDSIIIANGKLFINNNNHYFFGKLFVHELFEISQIRAKFLDRVIIYISDQEIYNKSLLLSIKKILIEYQNGLVPVDFYHLKNNGELLKINTKFNWKVFPKNSFLFQLKSFLGDDKVSLKFKTFE